MGAGRLRAGPAQVRRGLRADRGGKPHDLDPVAVQREAAPGDLRFQVRPLPGRSALSPPCRRAVLRHPADRQQPPGHPLAGRGLQDSLPAHPRDQGQQGRGGAAAARHPGGAPCRFHRPGPLHAGAVAGFHQPLSQPHHQHPPLLPARLPRRQALPARLRARREADRRDQPLRHRGAGRRPDHRAGRDPHQRIGTTWTTWCSKGADLEKVVLSRAVRWHIDNRILVYGNKTVVFD
jgi:hypothetical protein